MLDINYTHSNVGMLIHFFPSNKLLGKAPLSLVFICRENPRRSGSLLFPDCPRFCRLTKTQNRRYPRSSRMEGEKSGESGAFLFSRRVPDFCDGWWSFPTNENSNLYLRGRWRWISLITNPLNYWAPVPLSHKFQFLVHFPFPTKFIGRIKETIVAIIRYIWDTRQKVKAPIIWDFPDIWKPGFKSKKIYLCQSCTLRKIEGRQVPWTCKIWGAQHIICMQNVRFSSHGREKVRPPGQGPLGSARTQPCVCCFLLGCDPYKCLGFH